MLRVWQTRERKNIYETVDYLERQLQPRTGRESSCTLRRTIAVFYRFRCYMLRSAFFIFIILLFLLRFIVRSFSFLSLLRFFYAKCNCNWEQNKKLQQNDSVTVEIYHGANIRRIYQIVLGSMSLDGCRFFFLSSQDDMTIEWALTGTEIKFSHFLPIGRFTSPLCIALHSIQLVFVSFGTCDERVQ